MSGEIVLPRYHTMLWTNCDSCSSTYTYDGPLTGISPGDIAQMMIDDGWKIAEGRILCPKCKKKKVKK